MAERGRRPRVAILGAGIGGLGLAIRLKKAGFDDFVVYERNDGIGGTWRENTYPGAACDVPSHLYSYSFALNPSWSRTFAPQPEILEYLERCTDRYGIRRHVRESSPVRALEWNEQDRSWCLHTRSGDTADADVVVSAVGTFNTPAVPDIPGLDDFSGVAFHSARWDHSHDVTGRRVAVIGTGASAIQIVPTIAPRVERLDVFQRTPAWIAPRVDVEFTEEELRRFRRVPFAARRHRWQIYRLLERNAPIRLDDRQGELVLALVRANLEYGVTDPGPRARLTPDYPVGCKRILLSSDFYPALERENVELVTDPIERIDGDAILTEDGRSRKVDTIVFATGFRAADYLNGIEVKGRYGRSLHSDWGGVPRAHLGMTVSGYPNFFMLYGPNTNQGGNSIIFMLEAQARYVLCALRTMRRRRIGVIDVKRSVMDRYNERIAAALEKTVWNGGCESYFKSGSGQITTQLPHRSMWYWLRTRRFSLHDFEHEVER